MDSTGAVLDQRGGYAERWGAALDIATPGNSALCV